MESVPDSVISEIFRDQFPETEISEIRLFSRGWNSILYSINGKYIMKFPRDIQASHELEMDMYITERIRPYINGIQIPHYIHRHYHNSLLTGIYGIIEGEPLIQPDPSHYGKGNLFNELSSQERKTIAESLSEHLRRINRIPEDIFKDSRNERKGEWVNAFKGMLDEYRQSCIQYFPQHLQHEVGSFLDSSFRSIDKDSFKEVPIHADFGGWNILYSRKEGKITGILDWGGMMVGDPAYDISELIVSFGLDFAEYVVGLAYRNALNIIERSIVYANLAGFLDISYGIRLHNDSLIASGIRMILNQL